MPFGVKYLVVYATRRGSARQAAEWIAGDLDDCDLVDLKDNPNVDISRYDTIVIGSGILAGKAYPPVRKFIKRRKNQLAEKDVCLFITHLEGGEGVAGDFESAFDKSFLEQARVRMGVGGRLRMSQLNFFLRAIMKRFAEKADKDLSDYDTLSKEACEEFARLVRERKAGDAVEGGS